MGTVSPTFNPNITLAWRTPSSILVTTNRVLLHNPIDLFKFLGDTTGAPTLRSRQWFGNPEIFN